MKFSYKYLWALLPLIAILALLYYFSDIVAYILIAWVLSMIGAPVVVYFRRFLGKNLAAAATLGLMVVGFSTITYVFIPTLIIQAENLSQVDYHKVIQSLKDPINDWQKWLFRDDIPSIVDSTEATTIPFEDPKAIVSHSIIPDSVGGNIHVDVYIYNPKPSEDITLHNLQNDDDFFNILKNNISDYINPSAISKVFSSAVQAFGDILIGVFSVFFITFFFLREQGLLDNIILSVIPEKYEKQTQQAVDETSKLLIRYFIGVLIQITIIFIIISSGLKILGVQNVLLIAFFVAMLNVIPYIGPIIGLIFTIILTISSNLDLSFYDQTLPLIGKITILFACMNLIDNFLLQPNIFSKSVKAHPLEIFILVLIGAKVGGIMGMVLAIPSYIVIRVIGKVFLSEFKVIQSLTKNI